MNPGETTSPCALISVLPVSGRSLITAIFPFLIPTERIASSFDSGSITRPLLSTTSYCCAMSGAASASRKKRIRADYMLLISEVGSLVHQNGVLEYRIPIVIRGLLARVEQFSWAELVRLPQQPAPFEVRLKADARSELPFARLG